MKKLIMASITAVVVIVVLAGTLIPILDDATATSDTLTNKGYYRMAEITEDTETTIEWDHTKPTVITVDGTEISLAFSTIYTSYSFFASDVSIMRFVQESAGAYKIQKYGGTFASAGTVAETDASITISGMSVSYTIGTDTASFDITEGYVIDNDGEFIMKDKNTPAYVMPDDSIICLAGVTNVGGTDVALYAPGTVEDGLTFTALAGIAGATYSVGTPTFNYTDNSDYVDVINLSSVVFDFTRNDTTQTVTYSYFLVPYEVTAERAIHFTDGENAIFNAIPVMIIIALLLGVVALVLRSRMD